MKFKETCFIVALFGSIGGIQAAVLSFCLKFPLIWILITTMFGVLIGIFVYSLCYSAGQADERLEK